MRGNIPIPEIPQGEELWLMVVITSVREKRTQQGKRFCDATARNATGSLALKIWGETLDIWKEIKPGLWGITGKLETFQERCYQLGSLSAASGRVLSIAVYRGPIPGLDFGVEQPQSEHVFGIDEDGFEQDEKTSLLAFLEFMKDFDCDTDELVGHNLIGFDLPFIFQRCLVHCISAKPLVDLSEFRVRGVFDTMHHWWLGAKRFVSLDDVAWALGIESSKTATAEGSKVFDLYQAGKLAEIREYNLNDVRVTRRVYERMVGCFGR